MESFLLSLEPEYIERMQFPDFKLEQEFRKKYVDANPSAKDTVDVAGEEEKEEEEDIAGIGTKHFCRRQIISMRFENLYKTVCCRSAMPGPLGLVANQSIVFDFERNSAIIVEDRTVEIHTKDRRGNHSDVFKDRIPFSTRGHLPAFDEHMNALYLFGMEREFGRLHTDDLSFDKLPELPEPHRFAEFCGPCFSDSSICL